MANGRLASGVIASTNVWSQFYQVPVGFTASITINVCNQGSNNAKIRIALPSSTNVNPEDIVEFDVDVYKNESFQRTGLVLSSGQYVFIRSNEGSISINIWGFEEVV